MRLTVHVDGDVQLDRAFSRFGEEISNLRDIWPDVAQTFRDIEMDQFTSDGHGRWPDLSERYEEWKLEHHPFMPMMRLTQRLFLSLVRRNEDSVYEESDMELTLGTRVPYAIHHMRPGRRRPARPPIDLREEDKRRITKTVHRGLVRKAREVNSGWVQTEIEEF